MTVDELIGVVSQGQRIAFCYDCCYKPLVWKKDMSYDDFIYGVVPFKERVFLDSEVLFIYTNDDNTLWVEIEVF